MGQCLGTVKKGYTHFGDNDVIFAKITPCMENGKIAVAVGLKNGLAYGSTEFVVFRPYSGVSPRFILYFLLQPSFRKTAERHMTGASGQKRVPSNYLVNHRLLLPPTREQQRIVEKLDAALLRLERARNAISRAQKRVARYREAVLDAAVCGDLTSRWRDSNAKHGSTDGEKLLSELAMERRARWEKIEIRRLNQSSQQLSTAWKSRYQEPAVAEAIPSETLPKGWARANLDQLSWSAGYGTSVKCTYDAKGPAVLRIPNVRGGEVEFSDLKFAIKTRDLPDHLFVSPGDLLVIRTNGSKDLLGRAALVRTEPKQKCAFASYLIRYRLLGTRGLWSWLALAWESPILRTRIEARAATTAGQYNISLSRLNEITVPIPPLVEQLEIVRVVRGRLAAADRLEKSLQMQQARASAMHQSLLRGAFAGRLVPQDSTDEPSSILLKQVELEKLQRTESRNIGRKAGGATRKIAMDRGDSMEEKASTRGSLRAAWEKIGRKTDARRLFDEAGFDPSDVVQFYSALRATPEVRKAFEQAGQASSRARKPIELAEKNPVRPEGRFRLVDLWLEDFKNLKNYAVRFDPAQGVDVVLGWNGTGKSNLFEALVIIFRDLHDLSIRGRWLEQSMKGFRVRYEIDQQLVEIVWDPALMRRPELRSGAKPSGEVAEVDLEPIKRESLPLPRFVFAYYSGPTNRLAEHFLPMKQAHYERLLSAKSDDAGTLARLLEQRRFFCAETHHAKYVLLAFSYKEDAKITEFLSNRLRIVGFESALFIIRKPRWAHSRSNAEDFWGARGIMRRVMERLRRYAIAPMVLEQKVNDGYRSTTEDHYYFYLPDIESLHAFAAEYQDARTFFLALESTDFSELIHDVKIQVRVRSADTAQVPITFHELSEGEQQLLMVLGLMRFTKSHQSLVLLDEPDTHLNPHWSVDYLKDLVRVMSDSNSDAVEQQTSQILVATHDPLVIASLAKEQIHLLKRDSATGACVWEPASVNPRGLGFTGILTSEMFGFRSDLDPETLADLDNRVRLVGKEGKLDVREMKELESIDKRLDVAGFSEAFSDPYYSAFVRAWGRKHAGLMEGQPFITSAQREKIDQIAAQVLEEAVEEVKRESEGEG